MVDVNYKYFQNGGIILFRCTRNKIKRRNEVVYSSH